ncbi:hypothetical protein N7491_006492 [Penicillium cf. griseofulvum]|uniref:Uncharacterized protein n=1 Tax=Penicillium cf. griseofulvum TaxID=2972120 RepID=A0A9W9IV72_9EURO|nr:hypothetical protein N7472_010478 [Penicillium cf. griseofulvum]KAJ5429476.1 hypothetical protein N7491_006492 [Penicillium cf. griseofulvum]KAJ5436742.1 hypothetical protein N7445_007627 [Penicillium cf. griseofulvum]
MGVGLVAKLDIQPAGELTGNVNTGSRLLSARSTAISSSQGETEVGRVPDDSATRDDTIKVVHGCQQWDHNTRRIKEDVK